MQGVLGFFNFLQFGSDGSLEEGTVVLNGASVNSVGGAVKQVVRLPEQIRKVRFEPGVV